MEYKITCQCVKVTESSHLKLYLVSCGTRWRKQTMTTSQWTRWRR